MYQVPTHYTWIESGKFVLMFRQRMLVNLQALESHILCDPQSSNFSTTQPAI